MKYATKLFFLYSLFVGYGTYICTNELPKQEQLFDETSLSEQERLEWKDFDEYFNGRPAKDDSESMAKAIKAIKQEKIKIEHTFQRLLDMCDKCDQTYNDNDEYTKKCYGIIMSGMLSKANLITPDQVLSVMYKINQNIQKAKNTH